MKNYILFDTKVRESLKPFTFTRPISEIRCGILTITEKWNRMLQTTCSFKTEDYLQAKYALQLADENVFINSSIIPTKELVNEVCSLKKNTSLYAGELWVATNTAEMQSEEDAGKYEKIQATGSCKQLAHLWNIFQFNPDEINADFELVTAGRKSQPINETNRVLCPENVFIEEGAKVDFAIINASAGKVYIGKDAEVWENAVIRAPFAMNEHSVVKMSAKIYEGTTIGPHSKVGGEVQNSVIIGYSNKGHDGYLGNAVLGEWCNLGADTNNSNLKNDYSEVKIWNYATGKFEKTGLQFCGLMMGDHSKSAINTMFNTGTVVGVCANIYSAGFPRNFIPSFTRGGSQGIEENILSKAIETAKRVYARRHKDFDEVETAILTTIFEQTRQNRQF
ncbi:MAG: GlmU family protein [Bacteroidales bacterium]|nr:GlmU family protein [Bacteroidales bacterium]